MGYVKYDTEIDQRTHEWDKETLQMIPKANPDPPGRKFIPSGRYKFVVLQNATITNRSRSRKMSLGFTLRLKIAGSPDGVTDYPIAEDWLRHLKGHHGAPMLKQPLSVPTEHSLNGALVFVIDPMSLQVETGVLEEAVEPIGSSLEIQDHVSGDRAVITEKDGKFLFSS